MVSAIDPLNPTAGNATTQSVRENFGAAKTEIEALQVGKADATTLDAHVARVDNPHQVTRQQLGAGGLVQGVQTFLFPYAPSADVQTLHALGVLPTLCDATLVCLVADAGFPEGFALRLPAAIEPDNLQGPGIPGMTWYATDTYCRLVTPATNPPLLILTPASSYFITPASWAVSLTPFLFLP